jgi:DNA-directed RNA polymerase specialized sigma24 family protein
MGRRLKRPNPLKRQTKMAKGTQARLHYTLDAVEYLLKEYPALEVLQQRGDHTAHALVLDLDKIVEEAQFTELQEKCIDLVWKQGYKLREAGEQLGITPQGVRFHLERAKIKIKSILERWEKHGL